MSSGTVVSPQYYLKVFCDTVLSISVLFQILLVQLWVQYTFQAVFQRCSSVSTTLILESVSLLEP